MNLMSIPQPDDRPYPPRVSAFTEPFWTGLADGRFRTTRCGSCAQLTFPPKPICPRCWSEPMEWTDLPDSGILYSWTRVHAGPAIFERHLPYGLGIVDLDCGIRLACRLDGPPEQWRCGAQVRLAVLRHTDGPLLGAVVEMR